MLTSGRTTEAKWKASLIVGLLLVAIACVAAMPMSASAHATLISTDPGEGSILETTPEVVTLTFSESVSAVDGGTLLYVRGSDPLPLEPTVQDGVVVFDDTT